MSTEERIEIFHKFMKGYITPELEMWLKVRGFFKAPASTKYHGNYEGGLFDHCLSVADHLVTLTKNNNLKWENSRSPYVVGMFHDLCKIDSYQHPIVAQSLDGKPVYDESAWEYNNDTILKGHGDKSVMLLSQFYTLTMEEIAAIRYHMGAFVEKEEWRDYTRAVNQFPNVLWTHHADMLSSHVEGV